MTAANEPKDVVLVVDDEDSVRRTVADWLVEANLGIDVLTAADSGQALTLAAEKTIDLAVLDWNLGAGLNGLDLLHDLAEHFCPNIVAIMMTAFADRATPLDAMRHGVRDYLDKNHEFTRDNLVSAVRKQLDLLRPARRQRQINQGLAAFRGAVEKALPVVESLAALHDPVTLPEVIGTLFRFLINTTGAESGVLFVRHYDAQHDPKETCRVYDADGEVMDVKLTPFAQSIAASAISMQEPCAMVDLDQQASSGAMTLQPFEKGRRSLLAAPLAVATGVHVVLELFDKKDTDGFHDEDVRLVRDAGEFGAEMLRHALNQRRAHQVLLDAVEAALAVGDDVSRTIDGAAEPSDEPASQQVLAEIRNRLDESSGDVLDADDSVRLAEAVRVIAERHGPNAVRHSIQMIEGLRTLLDEAAGME